MPDFPKRNPRLQDRDFEILEHVMRYRITTPEVLHQLFFADCDRNAVTKVTSRLCTQQFLASYPLYGSNVYFALGKNGARVVGLQARHVKPLGPQALYREYGTLAYCCLNGTLREKLRVRDITKHFPALAARRIDSSHYYLDREGEATRLAYIWVEGGGAVDHIVRTVRDDIIEERRRIPALNQEIDAAKFVVAVVTMTPDKREAIIAALRALVTPVFFRVEVVSELIHLLPSVRHG